MTDPDREARRAAALRANLRRRKAAPVAPAALSPESPPEPPPADELRG
jgi:hypothetical protein